MGSPEPGEPKLSVGVTAKYQVSCSERHTGAPGGATVHVSLGTEREELPEEPAPRVNSPRLHVDRGSSEPGK